MRVCVRVCVCPEPCYDPVADEEDQTSTGLKRLSLRKPASIKCLKLKPSAWVSASKPGGRTSCQGGRTSSKGHAPNSEVSLIDFGDEFSSPSAPSPSPVVEIQVPSLAKLALEAESILDKTPPQSPWRSLPRPLHPTPVVYRKQGLSCEIGRASCRERVSSPV